jgi:Aminoglycoside-2''-adenylyltransferase
VSPDAEKMNVSQAVRPVSDVNDLNDAEIERLYGAWARLSPSDAFALLRDAPFRWWVAGGWAIEAVTQTNRDHWDTDVVVLRRDLELVREWFSGFHLWEVHEGTMRPLIAVPVLARIGSSYGSAATRCHLGSSISLSLLQKEMTGSTSGTTLFAGHWMTSDSR